MRIAIFFLLICTSATYSQSLEDADKFFNSGNFALAKKVYQKLLLKNVADSGKCSRASLFIVSKLAGAFIAQGQLDNSLKLLLEYKGCKGEISNIYNTLGAIYSIKKNVDSSIYYYQKALLNSSSVSRKANIRNNLGVLYADKNIDSSLYYYSLSLVYYKAQGDSAKTARSYSNIGRAFRASDYPDSALVYFKQSLIFSKGKGGYFDGFLALETLVSSAELLKNKSIKALNVINTADSLAKVLQSNIQRRSDKLLLLKQSKRVFNVALFVVHNLYKKRKDGHYRSLLFYYSERLKGNVLNSQIGADVLSIDQVQAGLGSKDAIVEYFQINTSLYCFVIKRMSIELIDLGQVLGKLFDSQIKSYVRGVNSLGLRDFLIESPKLYRLIFAKIAPYLTGVKRLVVVPSIKLSHIPFEGLMREPTAMSMQGYRSGTYLLRYYSITYHISATIAILYKGKRYKQGFVGFIHSKFDNNLNSLEYGEKEVWAARKLYKNGLVYVNDNAVPGRLKAIDSKILHVSTHGYYDFRNSTSGLWFKEGGKDRVLKIEEIFNLSPRANLVVLSGCFTAFGELVDGEGVVNLPYAFILSGSKYVLSSLYLIPDKTTYKFMGKFYAYSKKYSYAEALRLVKLDMLKTTLPLFWCSFTLTGY